MAPESLQCWQFSDKSTVWSFGILLWEMFSYGMQPYCGYSNHEVLDVIARQQLLSCPDQCPAKIYTLMMECWKQQPIQRPDFRVTDCNIYCRSILTQILSAIYCLFCDYIIFLPRAVTNGRTKKYHIFNEKKKSNVTSSGGTHLRGLALGLDSFEGKS